MRVRHRFWFVAFVAGTALALAACGSSGGGKTSTTTTRPSTSGNSASGGNVAAGLKNVDIVITGGVTATIKGTKGQCVATADGAQYDFAGQDYPDLGPQGALSVISASTNPAGQTFPENIKLVTSDKGLATGADTSGMSFSSDKKKVTLNQTVSGAATVGGPETTALIKGTITCN